MSGGRPTKYDPAFCDVAAEFMRDGYSAAALAGHLRVAYSTLRLWEKEHPEFSAAIKEGRAGAALWWEARLRDLAQKGEGNATACVFGLKNRVPEEWRDVSRVEQTGADGGPIEVSAREILKAKLDGSAQPG